MDKDHNASLNSAVTNLKSMAFFGIYELLMSHFQ